MVKSEASIIVENVHFALATIDRMYEETLSNYMTNLHLHELE